MADTKISALTALTGANVDPAADVLPIVDTSASTTKKIVVNELRNALGPVLATEQASTSGTAIDFTSIPSWVKSITVMLVGVSTNGTDDLLIQIGDSGGVETSGYLSVSVDLANLDVVTTTGFTTGFGVKAGSATAVLHGALTLTLEDAANFTWVISGNVANTTTARLHPCAGSKSLSAALDRVRITTTGGANTFDAGAVNILYE